MAFQTRIKQAREALKTEDGKPYSQTVMAKLLGIDQGNYKQYETRSMMPIYLLVKFCEITDQHPWYILTGQSGSRSPGSFPARPPVSLRTVPPEKPKSRASK